MFSENIAGYHKIPDLFKLFKRYGNITGSFTKILQAVFQEVHFFKDTGTLGERSLYHNVP